MTPSQSNRKPSATIVPPTLPARIPVATVRRSPPRSCSAARWQTAGAGAGPRIWCWRECCGGPGLIGRVRIAPVSSKDVRTPFMRRRAGSAATGHRAPPPVGAGVRWWIRSETRRRSRAKQNAHRRTMRSAPYRQSGFAARGKVVGADERRVTVAAVAQHDQARAAASSRSGASCCVGGLGVDRSANENGCPRGKGTSDDLGARGAHACQARAADAVSKGA